MAGPIVIPQSNKLPVIVETRAPTVVQVVRGKGDPGINGINGTNGTNGNNGINGGPGIQGPKGNPGSAPVTFTMDVPDTLWTISHGLLYVPLVTVYDTTGHEVDVDIDNSVVGVTKVRTYYPLAGKAIYV